MQATSSLPMTIAPAGSFTLNLLGGWRINQPYCKGGLAIDFATMRAWTAGHSQTPKRIYGYQLGTRGNGTNIASWPQVNPANDYGPIFDFVGHPNTTVYCTGLHYGNGLLWISPKEFYTAAGSWPATYVNKYSLSGNVGTLVESLTFANRPMQFFGGGFIKGGPSTLIGCGGYESGQDSSSGPCWMDQSGIVINSFPKFSIDASLREKRDSNYSTGVTDPTKWMTGPTPNPVWCAGRIWGGGLIINNQTCFFVNEGIGYLNYSNQGETFGVNGASQRKIYKYAPGSHFGTWQDFPFGKVSGEDIHPNGGLAYLLLDHAWGDNCPALGVFQVGAG